MGGLLSKKKDGEHRRGDRGGDGEGRVSISKFGIRGTEIYE